MYSFTQPEATEPAQEVSSGGGGVGRFIARWIWRLFLLTLLAVVGLNGWFLGRVYWLRGHNPATTSFMESGLARLQAKNSKAKVYYRWVPYENIAVPLKRAVIAAEDQKFLAHEGFDWQEMEKAYDKNEKKGRVVRGGSTISQQLAKNLFLNAERSYARKAEEALITLMIERVLPKRRILEIYLNVIEWGNGIYGAEEAAQHYYSVPAAQLDDDQAAHLAAMIPNPRFYDRKRTTPYLEQRAGILLGQMGYVSVP